LALDASEIRIGASGRLYVAPLETAAPTNTSDPWTDWTDLGYTSRDGAPRIVPAMEVGQVDLWQSMYPGRRWVQNRTFDVTFTLVQTNRVSLELAFGGGSWTFVSGTTWRYEPPEAEEVDERMFGLEVTDGTVIDRYIIERGMVSEIGEIPVNRDGAKQYELTVSALGTTDGTPPWHLITNDEAIHEGSA
jgi:hypothetical protein